MFLIGFTVCINPLVSCIFIADEHLPRKPDFEREICEFDSSVTQICAGWLLQQKFLFPQESATWISKIK